MWGVYEWCLSDTWYKGALSRGEAELCSQALVLQLKKTEQKSILLGAILSNYLM